MLKKSLKNQISLVLSIFFVVFIGMSNVKAANDSSKPFPKPICRIEIDNAHISKSMFKRQIGKWQYAGNTRSPIIEKLLCGT